MPTLSERFHAKIEITDGHWWWRGAVGNRGYGVIWDSDRVRKAHRVAYELYVEPMLPEHVVLRHLCQTKLCVNPDHLAAGTQAENMEMERQGKCRQGHPQPASGRTRSGNCKVCMKNYLKLYNSKALLDGKVSQKTGEENG